MTTQSALSAWARNRDGLACAAQLVTIADLSVPPTPMRANESNWSSRSTTARGPALGWPSGVASVFIGRMSSVSARAPHYASSSLSPRPTRWRERSLEQGGV